MRLAEATTVIGVMTTSSQGPTLSTASAACSADVQKIDGKGRTCIDGRQEIDYGNFHLWAGHQPVTPDRVDELGDLLATD